MKNYILKSGIATIASSVVAWTELSFNFVYAARGVGVLDARKWLLCHRRVSANYFIAVFLLEHIVLDLSGLLTRLFICLRARVVSKKWEIILREINCIYCNITGRHSQVFNYIFNYINIFIDKNFKNDWKTYIFYFLQFITTIIHKYSKKSNQWFRYKTYLIINKKALKW